MIQSTGFEVVGPTHIRNFVYFSHYKITRRSLFPVWLVASSGGEFVKDTEHLNNAEIIGWLHNLFNEGLRKYCQWANELRHREKKTAVTMELTLWRYIFNGSRANSIVSFSVRNFLVKNNSLICWKFILSYI